MNQNKIDYKKKKQLYEALGAKQFKKVVMQVEEIKWKTIKKIFPNYLTHYETQCEKKCRNDLQKAKNANKKRAIKNYYREQILIARREFNNDENRNYHMNSQRPTEILDYLGWNKRIHENALLNNLALTSLALGCIGIGFCDEFATVIVALQAVDATINWQCINLQNYNICRIQLHKDALERREIRRQEKAQKEYPEAAKAIEIAFENTKEEAIVPTAAEIMARMENPEQLRQFKIMIEQRLFTHSSSAIVAETGKGAKK